MTRLRAAIARWRLTYAEVRASEDPEAGIEILQAVILAAGLGAAAVLIVGAVTGAIEGWISQIPL